MAATVILDTLKVLDADESWLADGVKIVNNMRRSCMIHGLNPKNDSDWPTIYTECGTALDDAGLLLGFASSGDDNMIHIDRRYRIVRGDTSKVEAELIYERLGASFRTMGAGNWRWTSRGALKEETVGRDLDGEVRVEYFFPSNYKLNDALQGEFLSTGKLFGALVISDQKEAEGLLFAGSGPDAILVAYRGRVNSETWHLGDPGTWLVADVSYEPYDVIGKWWLFRFTFQFDPQGWNGSVRFVDPHTGEPPIDLRETDNMLPGQQYPGIWHLNLRGTVDLNVMFPPI